MSLGPDADEVLNGALLREERAVIALEGIAEALAQWVKLQAQVFEIEHPTKPEPRDATVTSVKSPEELLRESQGETGEKTTEEWLGTRERRVIEQSPERTDEPKVRRAAKTEDQRN